MSRGPFPLLLLRRNCALERDYKELKASDRQRVWTPLNGSRIPTARMAVTQRQVRPPSQARGARVVAAW
jgi:hypothetical protein